MGKQKPLFELVDHACRICGGRLLLRSTPTSVLVRCAECGHCVEVRPFAHQPYRSLCFCGVVLASGADAGLRCLRALDRSPEKPQEIVVRHVPPEQERKSGRSGPRPVRVSGGFES